MLTITRNQDSVSISGKTRLIKQELITLGGIWHYETSQWILPSYYDTNILDIYLNATYALKARQAEVDHQYDLLYAKKGKPSWVCCDRASILSVINQEIQCLDHV
jgi:hypothetical protein